MVMFWIEAITGFIAKLTKEPSPKPSVSPFPGQTTKHNFSFGLPGLFQRKKKCSVSSRTI